MCAGIDALLEKAFFISPIVDMQKLIRGMMTAEGVTEEDLCRRKIISTRFGEDLDWEYLRYVKEHPIRWKVPTAILYGGRDDLTSLETVSAFAKEHGATLTVFPQGEHWFHTPEQMHYLGDWILVH